VVERLRALSWVEIAGVVHDDQAPVVADKVVALPVDDPDRAINSPRAVVMPSGHDVR
jgi:hypothetical protein